jgi:hypothetical protein
MLTIDRSAFLRPGHRWPIALAATIAVADAAVTGAGTEYGWGLSGSPAADEVWCAAALAVALIVAVTRRRWFHPLSLPLALVAVMCLAAPLWVQATRQSTGLLYGPGYEPPGEPLAAALSPAACAALVLVVAGYLAGAAWMLAVTKVMAPPDAIPAFRYRSMRGAGFALLLAGAAAQALTTLAGAGAAYGADQLQYGLGSLLASAAVTAALAGLAVATIATPGCERATRMRDLLRGREWAALGVFMVAVAASGQRGGLIVPGVYLAWAFSTRVRPIPWRWALAALLLALWGGAAIAHNRADGGLWPGSPAAVAASAVGAVSSPAWLTQQTIEHVPSQTAYLHGSTYLAAAEAQLPGPVSRRLGATTRTASAVFRDIIGFTDPNDGFSESFPSEAYLNFGLPGCLGAGLFLGALMGWAWRRRRDAPAGARHLLYPVLLADLVYGFRSDALSQAKGVLYPMVIIAVVMAWTRLPGSPSAPFAFSVERGPSRRHADTDSGGGERARETAAALHPPVPASPGGSSAEAVGTT